jgi:uncharacterized membrane protein YfcA
MGIGLEAPLAAAAAFAAGVINALAGGGTLVTFPALTALGLTAITANTTSTVALCPGYFGGTVAQRRDLAGQGRRVALLATSGALGGTLGGVLLLATDEKLFRALVPWLLLVASLLLAVQGRVRGWITRRRPADGSRRSEAWVALPVFLGSIYGGYFGAGLGVVLLATLALAYDETLARLNAVKQTISLAVNVAAALFFVARGPLDWPIVAVMAGGSLVGGAVGGRLASRIRPEALRAIAVAIGLVAAAWYFAKR